MLLYLDLILLALYYGDHYNGDESLHWHASRKLEYPDFDQWFQSFQEFLPESSSNVSIIQNIQKWYEQVEEKKSVYLQEILDYRKMNVEIGHLSNLQKLRTSLLKTFPVMVEEEHQNYFSYFFTSLTKVLEELKFLERYPIYFIESVSSEKEEIVARKLTGSELNFKRVAFKSSQQLPCNQVFMLDKERGVFYDLHPFILYQECYYCIREERSNTWEVFMFQSRGKKRLYYTGAMHKVALREHLANYKELQKKKQKKFLASQAISTIKDIWEIAFQTTEDSLQSLKDNQILQSYYPRKQAEYVLDQFVEESKFPMFLLLGKKGVGKTVLLAETARKWVSRGKIVFFYRIFGDKALNLESEIQEAILGRNLAETIQCTKQNWVIILDGIENSAKAPQLLQSIAAFIQNCGKTVKIVLSMQPLFYKNYQKFFPQNFLMKINGNCPLVERNLPFYELTHLAQAEIKQAYCKIASDIQGAIPSYSSIPEKIRGILRLPALTRVFLLCLRHREIPRYLGIRDVMEGFVMNHVNFSQERREFVENLMKIVLSSCNFPISVDQIIESENIELIKGSLSFHVPSGLLQLIAEGLFESNLVPCDGEKAIFIQPTLSFLKDYLIYRTVALAGKHKDEMLCKYLSEIGKGKLCLAGVLYFSLLRLVDKQYNDRLVEVLKKGKDLYPGLSQILFEIFVLKEQTSSQQIGQGGYLDSLISSLINQPTTESIHALIDFAIYLYKEEKYLGTAYILEPLVQPSHESYLNQEFLHILLLAASSYQKIGKNRRALKLLKKAQKHLKKLENFDQTVDVFSFLGRVYISLDELEKAEDYFLEAYSNKEKISGSQWESKLFEDFGKLAAKQKEYKKALDYFKKQKDILEKSANEYELGDAFENIADIQDSNGDKKEAILNMKEAISLYKDMGLWKKLAYAQKKLGKILTDINEYQEAITNLADSLLTLKAMDHKIPLAEAYLGLAKISEQLKRYDECYKHVKNALEIFTTLGNESGMAQCHEKFGLVELERGKCEKAQEHFQKALKFYQQSNNKEGLGTLYNHLGMLYQRQEDSAKARHYYQECLKVRNLLNDIKGLGEVRNNIAVILAQEGDFPAALRELYESMNLYQKIEDRKGMAHAKSTEALIYHLQGDNSKALERYKECAGQLEEIKDSRSLGAIYNRIGLIYKQRGNFYDALAYFEKSVKIQEMVGDIAGLAASYNNIGLIYDGKNDYEKALEYYTKDLQITEKLGDKRGLATSYNNIAILHYNHRNYARSLWYLEKAVGIYEELGEKEAADKIKERIQHVKEKL